MRQQSHFLRTYKILISDNIKLSYTEKYLKNNFNIGHQGYAKSLLDGDLIMKIHNDYFIYDDVPKQLTGFWKATKGWGTVKISGQIEKDCSFHLVLTVQTLAQRFFSGIITIFTFGIVRNWFKTEKAIDFESCSGFEKVKEIVISCYQEMSVVSSTAQNVNEVCTKIFSQLSAKKNGSSDSLAQSEPDAATSAVHPLPLTPMQEIITNKLKQSTVNIVGNVLRFFMNQNVREMSPAELKEVLEVVREEMPPQVDERTKMFLSKMMEAIDQMLNAMKGMPEAFEALAHSSGDPEIRKKIVEGIALPFVKSLAQEFDRENTSIIDSMIAK